MKGVEDDFIFNFINNYMWDWYTLGQFANKLIDKIKIIRPIHWVSLDEKHLPNSI